MHINLHSILQLDDNLPPDPTVMYRGPKSILPKDPDFQALRPNFGWVNVDLIRDTLKNTTQWYHAKSRYPMHRHFRSRFPAANVSRLNETVATDTIVSNTPAADDGFPGHGGCTCVQIYTGTESAITEGFPMSDEVEMHKTMSDFIWKHGVPNALFSNNAKVVTSETVLDILRHFNMGQMFSEPDQQNQNPCERHFQDINKLVESLMDHTGPPAKYWLLCLMFSMYLFNHLALTQLDGKTPIETAHGYKPDISALLAAFHWWEPVYARAHDRHFPSESREELCQWVGVAEDTGNVLTYLLLTDDAGQLIKRSVFVRL
jgi:hypothetical protein